MAYAGFWRRFVAALIDGLIVSIPTLVFSGPLGILGMGYSYGAGLLIGFLYSPFFESSALFATPGKALLGMVVVSEAGEMLTFKQACIRFFGKYVSTLFFFIGYLMQPFTAKRQTLHDMFASSVVIRRESSPDMNYFTVWKENFKKIVATL
jgi:uncharacterized RDD family membrane protein YckC